MHIFPLNPQAFSVSIFRSMNKNQGSHHITLKIQVSVYGGVAIPGVTKRLFFPLLPLCWHKEKNLGKKDGILEDGGSGNMTTEMILTPGVGLYLFIYLF